MRSEHIWTFVAEFTPHVNAHDGLGFEEAAPAMFAGKQPVFVQLTAHWPAAIRNHAVWFAFSIT